MKSDVYLMKSDLNLVKLVADGRLRGSRRLRRRRSVADGVWDQAGGILRSGKRLVPWRGPWTQLPETRFIDSKVSRSTSGAACCCKTMAWRFSYGTSPLSCCAC